MSSFDLGQQLAGAPGLVDASHSEEQQTSAIDLQDYEGVAVLSVTGDQTTVDLADNPLELKFFEGDSTTFSEATEVPANRVVDNPAIDAEQSAFVASVVPAKRYLFVQVPAPEEGNVELAVSGVLGYPVNAPTS